MRAILNAITDTIGLLDRDGNILMVNEIGAERHGKRKDELVGLCLYDILPPDLAASRRKKCEEVLRSGKPLHFEDERDGRILDNSLYPIFDEKGDVAAIAVYARDITDRKRAEEERETLLQNMSERVKELKCMYGVADSIRKRKSLEEIFQDVVVLIPSGWLYPEMTRGKIRFDEKEFVSEPFKETEWKQSSHIVVRGECRGSVEVYYLKECPEVDEGIFLQEEHNLLEGITGALSEAVEHKQAEEEFRGVIEHSPIGIYRTTSEGTVLMANQALVRMLGYSSADELTQRNLDKDGYHPEYPRSEFKRRIENEGKILALESAWRKKDGTYVYLRESARAVFDKEGRPLFYEGMVEDITERKRAEAALGESEKKLSEQNIQLQEKNIALRQVMEQLSAEKEQIEQNIRVNVDQLLLPLLENVKKKGSRLDRMYIDLLENNLKDLTSSFGSGISTKMPRLTQREIEICNMIVNGYTSKGIARLLSISHRSVETHRNNIRRKLEITNKGINLVTYLKSLQSKHFQHKT